MELNKISGRTRLKKRGIKNKNGSTDNLSQAISASTVIGLILPIAGSLNDKHNLVFVLVLVQMYHQIFQCYYEMWRASIVSG